MITTDEAMDLYHENEKLVYSTINKRYHNNQKFLELHGLDNEDIKQFGKLGLLKACREYNPKKGTKFSSFAISNIIWSISTEAKKNSLGKDKSWTFDLVDRTSLDRELSTEAGAESLYSFIKTEESGYEDIIINDFIDSIGKAVSEKVAQMVRMRVDGDTYTEIGKYMGSSRQNVISMLKYHREKIVSLLPAS